jgi:hypothetical protein
MERTTKNEQQTASAPALEKHYSIAEIAKLWALSEKTVRKMFENEGGVLSWGRPQSNGKKRSYVSLRVPESIMIRIHQRMRLQH